MAREINQSTSKVKMMLGTDLIRKQKQNILSKFLYVAVMSKLT